jgi:putative transposase
MKLGRPVAIDPTVRDARYFRQAAGVERFAWNWALSRWNEDYAKAIAEPDEAKRKALWPSAEKLKAEWAERRRAEFPWSLAVTKCAGTQAIIELGKTFARATKEQREAKAQGRKPRKMFGFPKFKARNKTVPGFSIWNDQFAICNHYAVCGRPYATVRIPNLGQVRLREPVMAIGGILGARISHRRGRWCIAFQYDLDWNDGEPSDKAAQLAQAKARKAAVAAGMSKDEAKETITVQAERPVRLLPLHPRPNSIGAGDLGLIDALVGRVEEVGSAEPVAALRVPNPRRLSKTEKEQRLRRLRERRLSRSIHRARERVAAEAKAKRGDTSPVTAADLKGVRHRLSNRQKRLSNQLAKGSWRDADRRDDFLHKLSHQVTRSAEILVFEDLHVAGMMQNRALARHLSDAVFGKFGHFLAYKAEREGGIALFAPRFFPSSKRCSACGVIHADLKLDQREWSCEACGAVHDRDANAAANLCWLGQLAASTAPVPDDAQPWAEWIAESREAIAKWRQAKSTPRDFCSDQFVGQAMPEVTRGESAYRGRRKAARETLAEPRTKKGRKSSARGEQAHSCSPFG